MNLSQYSVTSSNCGLRQFATAFLIAGSLVAWQAAFSASLAVEAETVDTGIETPLENSEESAEERAEEISEGESLTAALLDTALVVTEQVTDPQRQVDLLIALAIAHSKANNIESTTATLEKALAIVLEIENTYNRAQSLIAIASTFHSAANDNARLDAALSEVIALVTQSEMASGPGLLFKVAETYIESGDYASAYTIPDYVDNHYFKADLERLLVSHFAGAAVTDGEGDRTLEFILNADFGSTYFPEDDALPRQVPIEITIVDQLWAIRALILAHHQEDASSEKLAELVTLYESMLTRFPSHQDRAKEHIALAQRLLDLEENELALSSLVQAEQALSLDAASSADTESVSSIVHGHYPLWLAELYVQAGELDRGIEIVESYRRMPLTGEDSIEAIAYKVEQLVFAVDFLIPVTQASLDSSVDADAKESARESARELVRDAERLARLIPSGNAYRRDALVAVAIAYQRIGKIEDAQRLVDALRPSFNSDARATLWSTEIFQWQLLLQAVGDYAQVIELSHEIDDFTVPFDIFRDLIIHNEDEQVEDLLPLILDPAKTFQSLTLIALTQNEIAKAEAGLDTMRRLVAFAEQDDSASQLSHGMNSAIRQYADVAEDAAVSDLLTSVSDEYVSVALAFELLPDELIWPHLNRLPAGTLKEMWVESLENRALGRSCEVDVPGTVAVDAVPHVQAQKLIEMAACAATLPPQTVDPATSEVLRHLRDR